MTGDSYEYMIDAIARFYNTSESNVALQALRNGVTVEQMYTDLLPSADSFLGNINPTSNSYTYNQILAKNGDVLAINYNTAESFAQESIASQINSNIGGGSAAASQTATMKIPINTSIDQQTGNMVGDAGVRTFKDGVEQTGTFKTVAGNVLQGAAAVATGIALGKKVGTALYEHGSEDSWWNADTIYQRYSSFWDKCAQIYDAPEGSLEEVASMGMHFLFDVDDTNKKTQAYMDERVFAGMAEYLAHIGMFQQPPNNYDVLTPTRVESVTVPPFSYSRSNCGRATLEGPPVYLPTIILADEGDYVRLNRNIRLYPNRGSRYIVANNAQNPGLNFGIRLYSAYLSGKTVWYNEQNVTGSYDTDITPENVDSCIILPKSTLAGYSAQYIAWAAIYGNVQQQGGGLPGTSDQPGATIPQNVSGWTDPDSTLAALKLLYPDLWDNRKENDVVQPDGSTKTVVYIPVPFPDGVSETDPQNPNLPTGGETSTQADPAIDPNNTTDSALQSLIDLITSLLNIPEGMVDPETDPQADSDNPLNPENVGPPATGEGDTPTVITPTGSASRLWSVYNPSQAEVNAFGAWLWSSSFIEQIKKLFNDPMQAIIGIHKIFATPNISGTGTIVCGYIDSEVSSNIVGAQYTTVDCGSINLSEYFGNVFDYEETDIHLYLPFIGIVQIDPNRCIRGQIQVIYRVDVYSGACLAEVSVRRDGAGGVIYTYNGDCAVRYPISSGSYMGIVSGIITAAGGLIGGVMTGNPLMAGAGIVGGLSHSKSTVQMSGNISGNSGAMGAKKPYLIISRPQSEITDYLPLQGSGANKRVTVGSVSGYARFSDVRLYGVTSATEEEKREIETILTTGVYL